MGVDNMAYNRLELLKTLETVSPAISNNVITPILTCLGFTGTEVFAYNDEIAISTPLETEFKGAIEGELLINLLKTREANEVEFSTEGDVLVVKTGRAKAKFAIKDNDNFGFKMPEFSKGVAIEKPEFFAGVECCLRSIGSDPSIPDQTGVTLIPNEDGIGLYATNNATISWVELDGLKTSLKDRIILPEAFCKQMISLKSDSPYLELNNKYALYTDGPNALFSKYVESNKPVDFKEIINHHWENVNSRLVEFPKNLETALDSAVIITEKVEHKSMVVSIKKPGKLHFHSLTKDQSELSEWLTIDENHPLVTVNVEPGLIKKGSKFFNKWVITDSAVIMTRENMVYLVGTTGA